jgi:ApbE superfamily uncharacterized protein (UPF0280 family)
MVLKCDRMEGIERAKGAVGASRLLLENYIASHPDFIHTLQTERVDLTAPEIVRKMMEAGILCDVGPMASVAGALSEIATDAMISVGAKLALAENGGDISVKGEREVRVGIYAGEKSIARQLGFRIKSDDLPLAICTSSGTLGHSISMGESDAVVVFSKSAYLADAAATSLANLVVERDPEGSIQNALEKAEGIDGISGGMVLIGELVGRWGKLPEMVEVIDFDL